VKVKCKRFIIYKMLNKQARERGDGGGMRGGGKESGFWTFAADDEVQNDRLE
jgi:hypothetical protein